ncbi:unnamed protein product [Vitrella brassicaformis CCMP3155]|uniref:BTB domain-containing protein n=2 Tax=Vitrella brassicaformis TaxID=1169539 RepID=A0A0G4FP29_VITBC|nr:unnamed protein product [Vitrella brassicaformis CCMP3155]|eukprot:CEM15987.1 unnamed protein product [Vitrella brassicaformis CCMP3155]
MALFSLLAYQAVHPTTMTSFVRLNVGGREFSVAKSTLSRHPDTLLGQLVTNESTAEYQQIQQGQPVFIDADPSLFPCVVDYYRHGTPILIDSSVDKRKLMREMRFFGINVSQSDMEMSEEDQALQKDGVARRMANKIAYAILGRVPRPTPPNSTYVRSLQDHVVAACEWVGPDADWLKVVSSKDDVHLIKHSILIGMVSEELDKMIAPKYRSNVIFHWEPKMHDHFYMEVKFLTNEV